MIKYINFIFFLILVPNIFGQVDVTKIAGYGTTYLVTIDLTKGAIVEPYAKGPINSGANACRGWYNTFEENSVAEFSKKSGCSYAKIILSGSFHDDRGKPAFPLKMKDWIATYGCECNPSNGSNAMLMLQIRNNEQRAFIEPFNLNKFNATRTAPNVIVGLSPLFRKGFYQRKGRHYLGLSYPHNGGYGKILSLISTAMTQQEALNFLKKRGCPESQIIQFDGSTIAQLSFNKDGQWNHLISNTRGMPVIFLVY